jgi:hypothetical protein
MDMPRGLDQHATDPALNRRIDAIVWDSQLGRSHQGAQIRAQRFGFNCHGCASLQPSTTDADWFR